MKLGRPFRKHSGWYVVHDWYVSWASLLYFDDLNASVLLNKIDLSNFDEDKIVMTKRKEHF